MVHSKHWKNVERKVARLFGAERNPCSGSFGHFSLSDSLHRILYIETKHFTKAFIFSLYEKTKKQALAENKIPVVVMHKKGTETLLFIMEYKNIPRVKEQMVVIPTQED